MPSRARDNKLLVTHLMTDQRFLTSAIAHRSALAAGPSSSSKKVYEIIFTLAVVSTRLPALGVVGYGPFSLCVIHEVGLCLSSGDINRPMIIFVLSCAVKLVPFLTVLINGYNGAKTAN
jgi:heme/copper-type cytochrome/quinol oxidase subunit 4